MNYTFHSIKLSIFDLHIALRPLLLPESEAVNDSLRFLVEREGYQDYYKQIASTDSFSIVPLEKSVLRGNRFWQVYMRIPEISWLNNTPDFWNLQIPFVARPKMKVLCNDSALKLSEKGIQTTVEPEIFITGIGWTTSINIHLEGEIDPCYLIELIAYFRTGRSPLSEQDVYPFLVQNGSFSEPMRLNQLYAFIANKLRSELYNVPRNSPGDKRVIERYHVISIKKYEGEPLLYRREKHDKPNIKVMSPSEQALMHSLVYGRFVDEEEALQQIEGRTLLYTQFDDANFALTGFDHGTLHFMQEILRKENLSPETLDCMGNNILIFLRIIFALYHFYNSSKGAKNVKIVKLRGNICKALKGLAGSYTNKFCEGFYDNYDHLSQLIELCET
jgi:hypothetical protein